MGFSTKPRGCSRIACAILPCERDSSPWWSSRNPMTSCSVKRGMGAVAASLRVEDLRAVPCHGSLPPAERGLVPASRALSNPRYPRPVSLPRRMLDVLKRKRRCALSTQAAAASVVTADQDGVAAIDDTGRPGQPRRPRRPPPVTAPSRWLSARRHRCGRACCRRAPPRRAVGRARSTGSSKPERGAPPGITSAVAISTSSLQPSTAAAMTFVTSPPGQALLAAGAHDHQLRPRPEPVHDATRLAGRGAPDRTDDLVRAGSIAQIARDVTTEQHRRAHGGPHG